MPAPFGRKPEGEGEGRGAARSSTGGPSGALAFGRTTTDGTDEGAKDGERRGRLGDAVPALALPKGGGAMRGLGEQFQIAAFTGTGSLSIPVATSPGRSGFGPGLSLRYDKTILANISSDPLAYKDLQSRINRIARDLSARKVSR